MDHIICGMIKYRIFEKKPMAYSTSRKTTNAFGALLLSVIALPAIQGCTDRNDEKPLVFPITLYANAIDATSGVQMFTYDGEITDPNEIEKFIAGMGMDYFAADGLYEEWKMLTFTSGNRAESGDAPNDGHEPREYSVTKEKDRFTFVSDLHVAVPTGRWPTDDENAIFKHRYPLIPSAMGQYLTREIIVAYGTHTRLRFPIMAYKATRGSPDGGGYSTTAGLSLNEFNEASIGYLRPHDTVAIRSFDVYAKARP